MSNEDQSRSDVQTIFERALLRSARLDEPRPQATEQAWLKFSSSLAAATISSGTLPAGGAGSDWTRLFRMSAFRCLLVGAITGSAATLAWVRTRPAAASSVAVPSPHTFDSASDDHVPSKIATRQETTALTGDIAKPEPQAAPTAQPRRAAAKTKHVAEQAPAVSASTERTASDERDEAPSTLAAEAAALDAARTATNRGAFHRSLELLQRYRTSFPSGVLRADAAALTIETLYVAGQRGEASRHAEQFLMQYPNDPHTAAVRRLILR